MTAPTISVIGAGASGAHCVRSLFGDNAPPAEVRLFDERPDVLAALASEVERAGTAGPSGEPRLVVLDRPDLAADVVVLATPTGTHVELAVEAIAAGSSVVSMSDEIDDVRQLIGLDEAATRAGVALVVGAGFAPGLTCLLARHAGNRFDEVAEISVAKAGTGGPACARQHHRAMTQTAWDWFDGRWTQRAGGSGRDLVWFPPPIGARDSYKAGLPSPLLLQRPFPGANRIVARVTATRRDRMTSRLPMLRPPHDDGGPGAVRVEVRGRMDGRFETLIYAVAADPSRGAGVVSAVAAHAVAGGMLGAGAFGLSEVEDPLPLLHALVRSGVAIMTFDGGSRH